MAQELDPSSDSGLVQRVVAGDTEAYAGLVRRHGPLVRRIVARHVPRDQTDDLTQEAFVRTFESLANFQLGTRFPEWLTTITVRACLDFWRGQYRRRETADSRLGESHQEWAERVTAARSQDAFEQETRRGEAREVLDYALAKLSPEDRLAISLVHLEGLSIEEASRQLGWSVANVKVRTHRSRRRMRKTLEELLGDGGPAGEE
jgi:RNA polymerase sigma-70 factor (ECF subfamily)